MSAPKFAVGDAVQLTPVARRYFPDAAPLKATVLAVVGKNRILVSGHTDSWNTWYWEKVPATDVIIKTGTVHITADEIVVDGFTFDMAQVPPDTQASQFAVEWARRRLGA